MGGQAAERTCVTCRISVGLPMCTYVEGLTVSKHHWHSGHELHNQRQATAHVIAAAHHFPCAVFKRVAWRKQLPTSETGDASQSVSAPFSTPRGMLGWQCCVVLVVSSLQHVERENCSQALGCQVVVHT